LLSASGVNCRTGLPDSAGTYPANASQSPSCLDCKKVFERLTLLRRNKQNWVLREFHECVDS
jgi:hypothetical protein